MPARAARRLLEMKWLVPTGPRSPRAERSRLAAGVECGCVARPAPYGLTSRLVAPFPAPGEDWQCLRKQPAERVPRSRSTVGDGPCIGLAGLGCPLRPA